MLHYKTILSIDECRNIIKNINSYKIDNSKFIGTIVGKYFTISVLFFYSNLFRPTFYGRFIEKNEFTYIQGFILFINPFAAIIIFILYLSFILIFAFHEHDIGSRIAIIAIILSIILSYFLIRKHPKKIKLFIKEIFKIVE